MWTRLITILIAIILDLRAKYSNSTYRHVAIWNNIDLGVILKSKAIKIKYCKIAIKIETPKKNTIIKLIYLYNRLFMIHEVYGDKNE